MASATVEITADGCVPIPSEVQRHIKLHPSDTVIVRVEDDRLIIEKPSRSKIIAEIKRLCAELRTGEPLEEAWREIEQGREEDDR